ncbi:hypothetical protein HALLA_12240 [Halostagnicola larsenii XH-48]|uniref:Uncharacterized protein n=1 Tax=Halostagnicola larsenii XH-48 TaxID=797299 RepID=W0JQR3_9EURY|nr:hypothetical protein [Halostagnicola larsenii]AHG00939.1 hypothetical protein HALLA_11925 [Halostagnicola larsenii XH-48]AHG00991.1 hypothetical protein HALLA_12240 [Halostagnicola larsenii XH-48]
MTDCTTCGNRDYLCQECKHEALEARHGTPADNFDTDEGIHCWVQALDETWCASMYLEGSRHVGACGTIHETPVEGVRYDPRRLESEDVCPDCLEALEDDDEVSLPDGGRFERATELRADGGLEEITRRETIVATDDGIAIGEDAAPEVGRDD